MCSFDGEHADVCYAFAPVYYFLAFSGGFNLALVIAPFGIRLFSVIVRLCIVRSWDGVYCMFRYIEFELYRLFHHDFVHIPYPPSFCSLWSPEAATTDLFTAQRHLESATLHLCLRRPPVLLFVFDPHPLSHLQLNRASFPRGKRPWPLLASCAREP